MGAGLTGAVSVAATTTACGSDSGDQEVVLRLLATEYGEAADSGSTEAYWNDLVAEFREENPNILIDVSVIRYQDANSEVARLAEEGNPPDIAQIFAFAEFAEAGQLHPASELLTLPVIADFVPQIAVAGELERVQYALPFASTVFRLFYNKQLFRSAGLDDEQPPTNWEEMLEAAVALRDAGVPTPIALPFAPEEGQIEAMAWMLAGGGGLTDNTGVYSINNEANIETFTWLRDEVVAKGLAGSGIPAETQRATSYVDFSAGEVGMVMADSLLLRQADVGGVDYGVIQVPGRHGPTPSALGQASWVMGFNTHGHGEQIAAFLDFVYTNTTVASLHERYDFLPVTTPGVYDVRGSEDPERQRLVPFIEELDTATFFPIGKVSWTTVGVWLSERIGETLRPDSDIPRILGRLQDEARELDGAQ
ncbi:extracellular solute-binding protein [Streptomyces sp. 4N509B]|uniref:extracellular solute-binding protein n=1 Tax=Streptomyces sp. 4N509B TaxID=3457413 RepID=UPI003FD20DDE